MDHKKTKPAPKTDDAQDALRRIAESRRIAEEAAVIRAHHTSRWARRKAAHQSETNSWARR